MLQKYKTSSERNGKHVRRTCARRELHRHGFMSKEFLWKISFLRMWTEKLFLERDAWLDTKSILSLLKANKMLACDFELKLIYIFFVHIWKSQNLTKLNVRIGTEVSKPNQLFIELNLVLRSDSPRPCQVETRFSLFMLCENKQKLRFPEENGVPINHIAGEYFWSLNNNRKILLCLIPGTLISEAINH